MKNKFLFLTFLTVFCAMVYASDQRRPWKRVTTHNGRSCVEFLVKGGEVARLPASLLNDPKFRLEIELTGGEGTVQFPLSALSRGQTVVGSFPPRNDERRRRKVRPREEPSADSRRQRRQQAPPSREALERHLRELRSRSSGLCPPNGWQLVTEPGQGSGGLERVVDPETMRDIHERFQRGPASQLFSRQEPDGERSVREAASPRSSAGRRRRVRPTPSRQPTQGQDAAGNGVASEITLSFTMTRRLTPRVSQKLSSLSNPHSIGEFVETQLALYFPGLTAQQTRRLKERYPAKYKAFGDSWLAFVVDAFSERWPETGHDESQAKPIFDCVCSVEGGYWDTSREGETSITHHGSSFHELFAIMESIMVDDVQEYDDEQEEPS